MNSGEPAHIAKSMRPVRVEIVSKMLAMVRGETDPVLMQQFGISYNTWRKIRSGNAIRWSLAERLETRLACERVAPSHRVPNMPDRVD